MIIVWITWTLGAGKWTIVEYLVQKKWFHHYSVRSFLIQEIEKKWLPVNRDSMVAVANELREKFWSSYIAEQLYEQAKKNGANAIIESLRALGEVEALKQKEHFLLFAIDADPQIRYDRVVLRASETDRISFEEFISNEQREMQNDDPTKQNLLKCMQLADYTFINNGTLEELNDQIASVLAQCHI